MTSLYPLRVQPSRSFLQEPSTEEDAFYALSSYFQPHQLGGISEKIENVSFRPPLLQDINYYFPENVHGGVEDRRLAGDALTQTTTHPEERPTRPPRKHNRELTRSQAHLDSGSRGSLMWGSDLSFGPDYYCPPPDAAHATRIVQESSRLFTDSVCLALSRAMGGNAANKNTSVVTQQAVRSQTRSESKTGATQNITGKKRRRLLHIVSERNRRHNLRTMYDELYSLVPDLDPAMQLTRRKLLAQTADWLEQLMDGNKMLQDQLMFLTYPTF